MVRFSLLHQERSLPITHWYTFIISFVISSTLLLVDDIISSYPIVRGSAVNAFYQYLNELPEELHAAIRKLAEVRERREEERVTDLS